MPDAEVEFLRMADCSLENCKGYRHCMSLVECGQRTTTSASSRGRCIPPT